MPGSTYAVSECCGAAIVTTTLSGQTWGECSRCGAVVT